MLLSFCSGESLAESGETRIDGLEVFASIALLLAYVILLELETRSHSLLINGALLQLFVLHSQDQGLPVFLEVLLCEQLHLLHIVGSDVLSVLAGLEKTLLLQLVHGFLGMPQVLHVSSVMLREPDALRIAPQPLQLLLHLVELGHLLLNLKEPDSLRFLRLFNFNLCPPTLRASLKQVVTVALYHYKIKK